MSIAAEDLQTLLDFDAASPVLEVPAQDELKLPPLYEGILDLCLDEEPSLQTLLDAPVTEDHDFTIDDLLTKEQEASVDEPIDLDEPDENPIKGLPWVNNQFITFAVDNCKIKPHQLKGNRVTVMTYPDWGRIPADSIDWSSMSRWPIKQLYVTDSDIRKSRRYLRIPYVLFEAKDTGNRTLQIFVGPSLLLRCTSPCHLRNLNRRLRLMGEPYNCDVRMPEFV